LIDSDLFQILWQHVALDEKSPPRVFVKDDGLAARVAGLVPKFFRKPKISPSSNPLGLK
jgi:hypothetical protein